MAINEGPLVIAVDTSTTSSKAIIVDAEGAVISEGKREIPLITPDQGFFEHDPTLWWISVDQAVSQAVDGLDAESRDRIAAMAVTHQRESFAPFDEDGTPLRNGILWLDQRATRQIQKYGSERIHALSGKPADVTPALYKMAWMKENEPKVFRKAAKIVDVHGYVVRKLTGQWVSSVACADSLGLFDIERQKFSTELLEIAGVSLDQMSDLKKPGEIIDQIRPSVTRGWGLKQSILLVAGMGDGQAAGIGAAAVEPNVAYLNFGTAVNAGVHSPHYQWGKIYRTLAAGLPDWYDFELLQSSGSFLVSWFREKLGNPRLGAAPDPALEQQAAAVDPGCNGLLTLPYWNAVQAPYWEPVARGAVVGWRGSHDRGAMYRSILESIAMEMRRNLDGLERATGIKIDTIRAMGGGTRSGLWRQIMTDVIGAPITACRENEVTALGAAVAAMSITGVHGQPDIAEYAKKMASFTDVTEPDQDRHAIYQEVAEIQGKIYSALKDINDDILDFTERHPDSRVTGRFDAAA